MQALGPAPTLSGGAFPAAAATKPLRAPQQSGRSDALRRCDPKQRHERAPCVRVDRAVLEAHSEASGDSWPLAPPDDLAFGQHLILGDSAIGVAAHLGLGDGDSSLLGEARAAWRGWLAAGVGRPAVPRLDDLRGWMASADLREKHDLVAALASMTGHDEASVSVLAWLLLPGARRIAHELGDRHPDIDGLVAGQFWIEVAGAHRLRTDKVAATIIAQTRREVLADLGIGDRAARHDRAWASTVLDDTAALQTATTDADPSEDFDSVELLRSACLDDVLVGFDVRLVWDLAVEASKVDAPSHRGRLGLTTPAVVEAVARHRRQAPRTLRRRATNALDRLREYAVAREDPDTFDAWKARHPVIPLTPREELELAIHEEQWWSLMTGPEELSPDDAHAAAWRPPGRALRA